MSVKAHMSNGEWRRCEATVRPCPLGGDENHRYFANEDEMRETNQTLLDIVGIREHGRLPGITPKVTPTSDESEIERLERLLEEKEGSSDDFAVVERKNIQNKLWELKRKQETLDLLKQGRDNRQEPHNTVSAIDKGLADARKAHEEDNVNKRAYATLYELRVDNDQSIEDFIEDRTYNLPESMKEREAKLIVNALWEDRTVADYSKVPNEKDYIVYGDDAILGSQQHKLYKGRPQLLKHENDKLANGNPSKEHLAYLEVLDRVGVKEDEAHLANIHAVQAGMVELPNGRVVDKKKLEKDWGVSVEDTFNTHGYLQTPTKIKMYEEDKDNLSKVRDSIKGNLHKPISSWDSKPEVVAVQDWDGKVSIYSVDYYNDGENKIDGRNASIGFRGTDERVLIKNATVIDTYSGEQAKELIKLDLVNNNFEYN